MLAIGSLPKGRICLKVAVEGPQLTLRRKGIIITRPFQWALSIFVRFPKAAVLPINSSIAQKVNQHFQQEYCASVYNPLLR